MKTARRANAIDMHIGRRIREGRLALEISQTELAEAIGITFQQVQKYEKGANRVGGGRLQAISTKLNKPVAWFYEGAPGRSAKIGEIDDPLLALGQTKRGVYLARIFVALTREQQDALIAVADSMPAPRHAKAA